MSTITWVTPRGMLGRIPEAEYFEYQLTANNAASGPVRFFMVSGELPLGMQINQVTGLLSGVPVVTRKKSVIDYTFNFTIRAVNSQGDINDQRFTLIVTGILPVEIVPRDENLGSFYDGLTYSRQLTAVEINPDADVTWRVVRGTVPTGLTLSSSGLLAGYLSPIVDRSTGEPGWDSVGWDIETWDFYRRYITKTFEFLVEASDGYSIDRINYVFRVVARPFYTADNSQILTNDASLTIDINGRRTPWLLTAGGNLPPIRQGTNYLYKFEAEDFDGDEIEFRLISVNRDFSNTGLTLDVNTGWLTGTVRNQSADITNYQFEIIAFKKFEPSLASAPIRYTLKVYGDLTNIVTWHSNEYLGEINNGQVSIFSVSATAPSGKSLYYARKDGDPGQLPPGLILLPSGLIGGQCSFRHFAIDQELETDTTFDRGATTFDTVYKVNILARDYENNIEAEKTFTIKVNVVNKKPYQNLYLTALPSLEQREYFREIISDTNLFPTELLFRPDDPYFGKASKIRSLFIAGLEPAELESYAHAAEHNHYDKKLEFGEIKTAVALDSDSQPIYEVVYIELRDNLTTIVDGQVKGPAKTQNLSGQIKNPYYTEQGVALRILEPNSFENMTVSVGNQLGYVNRGAYPRWMTSRQPNGSVLGLVRAVVLAHTVPGAAELMAFRLKQRQINFGEIHFVADRYEVDTRATKYFDIAADKFLTAPETVFDRELRTAEKTNGGSVDYAVSKPFDLINGRQKFFVQTSGLIDGAIDFTSGQTLIFARQQLYTNYSGTNDGWFTTVEVSPGQSETQIIPGYYEKTNGTSPINYRAGVWQINITSGNIVQLTFVREIYPNYQVFVKQGNKYKGSYLFYDPVIKPGKSVPEYSPTGSLELTSRTVFDNNGTRFYTYRDNYTRPTDDAKYIKFPQFGVIK